MLHHRDKFQNILLTLKGVPSCRSVVPVPTSNPWQPLTFSLSPLIHLFWRFQINRSLNRWLLAIQRNLGYISKLEICINGIFRDKKEINYTIKKANLKSICSVEEARPQRRHALSLRRYGNLGKAKLWRL